MILIFYKNILLLLVFKQIYQVIVLSKYRRILILIKLPGINLYNTLTILLYYWLNLSLLYKSILLDFYYYFKIDILVLRVLNFSILFPLQIFKTKLSIYIILFKQFDL